LRYSHEIETKNAILERLNQDKNEFLGMAAHDLKNPLSAILGLSEMIVNDFDELPKQEIIECTKAIILSAKQMFDLIVNLLDVNRIESGQFHLNLEPTDLLPILQMLVNNYQDRAHAKQLTLHFQPPEMPWRVLVDPQITYQVWDNLISNTIKYSPPMTHIDIRLVQMAQTVRCEIQDEGLGLSEIDQQKLFGKFARLTTQPTGGEHSTGLGLFIVKKWVTAMNGRVWCESELGKGATFIVEFARMA
jgi:signal transduction histidine kinase